MEYLVSNRSNIERIRYFLHKKPLSYDPLIASWIIMGHVISADEFVSALAKYEGGIKYVNILHIIKILDGYIGIDKKFLSLLTAYYNQRKDADPLWTFTEEDFLAAAEQLNYKVTKYIYERTKSTPRVEEKWKEINNEE